MEDPKKTPHSNDVRDAIDAVLRHGHPPVTMTKVLGCSIKWKEKSGRIRKACVVWANKTIALSDIGVDDSAANSLHHPTIVLPVTTSTSTSKPLTQGGRAAYPIVCWSIRGR